MRAQELCRMLGCGLAELSTALPAPLDVSLGGQHVHLAPPDVRKLLSARGVPYDFRTVAFINLKGGVGKTTSSLAVASRAAHFGYRVCVVDLDAQASATLAFGEISDDEETPVFNSIWQDPQKTLSGALRHVDASLSYLPSSLENSLLDVSLMNPASQKKAASGVVAALKDMGYDLVILDCPPSLGGAVISAICAADTVVIPVACDAFSQRGLSLTIEEIASIRETFGLSEPEIRILPTMLDRRSALTEPTLARLKSAYHEKLLPVGVRTSTLFARMLESKKTLYAKGVRRTAVHGNYDEIVKALLHLNMLDMGQEEDSNE